MKARCKVSPLLYVAEGWFPVTFLSGHLSKIGSLKGPFRCTHVTPSAGEGQGVDQEGETPVSPHSIGFDREHEWS